MAVLQPHEQYATDQARDLLAAHGEPNAEGRCMVGLLGVIGRLVELVERHEVVAKAAAELAHSVHHYNDDPDEEDPELPDPSPTFQALTALNLASK